MRLVRRNAEPRDLPAIKRMIDKYLGVNYYTLRMLESLLDGEQNLFYVVTDADRDDAVIFFFYALVSPIDEALKTLHVSVRPSALDGYGPDALAGVYKTSCTEEEYQKRGLCSSFIRDLEPVMRARGAKMILATALHPVGQEVPMRHIFRNNGFSAIAEILRPWVDMTEDNMYCPYCKLGHCICNAVFYMKKLDDTKGGDFDE